MIKYKVVLKNLVSSLISGTMLLSSPVVLACDNYSCNSCSISNTFKELSHRAGALAICVLEDFRFLAESEKIDEKMTKELVVICGFVFEICNNLGNYLKNIVPSLGLDTSNLLNNIEETIPVNIESLHNLYNEVSNDKQLTHNYLSSSMLVLVQTLNKLSCLSKTVLLPIESELNYECLDLKCSHLKECYDIMLDIGNILDEQVIRHHVYVDKILEYSDKIKNDI